MTTTMTIRLPEAEKKLIGDYARTFGTSMSDFVREAALEKIEDELDLQTWRDAKAEFDADPDVFTSDQLLREFLD